MVNAVHFIASWQLFPEKGSYEKGSRPKSGIYRISYGDQKDTLMVQMNWVSLEDQAYSSGYSVRPNGEEQPFDDLEVADHIKSLFADDTHWETTFIRNGKAVIQVSYEITPKGYLQITEKHFTDQGAFTNTEVYHKQLSVLPYSASVSGAVIKPTEEGVIRHKALSAMEEQTNMQLTQIRQQIELLAIQAKEIQQRKELSMIIYGAKLSFQPVIGQTYYLYEKENKDHLLSLVSPKEWGAKIPFKRFVAAVCLLADHTWKEV